MENPPLVSLRNDVEMSVDVDGVDLGASLGVRIDEGRLEALRRGIKGERFVEAEEGRLYPLVLLFVKPSGPRLSEGVVKYDGDATKWRKSLDDPDFQFHESRNTVDLKDKWRNILKKDGAVEAD